MRHAEKFCWFCLCFLQCMMLILESCVSSGTPHCALLRCHERAETRTPISCSSAPSRESSTLSRFLFARMHNSSRCWEVLGNGCLEGRRNSVYTPCPSQAEVGRAGQHHKGSQQKGINSYSQHSPSNVLKGTAGTPVDHFLTLLWAQQRNLWIVH